MRQVSARSLGAMRIENRRAIISNRIGVGNDTNLPRVEKTLTSEQINDDTPVASSIRRARAIGQTLVGSQLQKQAALLGDNVAEFGETLSEIALEFEGRGRGAWLVPACDYVAARVDRVAAYLRDGSNDRFASDFSRYAGDRPAVVGAAALVSGFALARILRVSIAEQADSNSSRGALR